MARGEGGGKEDEKEQAREEEEEEEVAVVEEEKEEEEEIDEDEFSPISDNQSSELIIKSLPPLLFPFLTDTPHTGCMWYLPTNRQVLPVMLDRLGKVPQRPVRNPEAPVRIALPRPCCAIPSAPRIARAMPGSAARTSRASASAARSCAAMPIQSSAVAISIDRAIRRSCSAVGPGIAGRGLRRDGLHNNSSSLATAAAASIASRVRSPLEGVGTNCLCVCGDYRY